MVDIKILDCTLRDGGYVNDFKFGCENISKISNNLAKSKIDIIELGFLKNGEHLNNQTLFTSPKEAEKYITDTSSEYCLMIRPDWYDISQLTKSNKIQHIRFAFHKNDISLTLKQANIARELGYKVYFNPVNVMSYSADDLKDILKTLNEFTPEGIYIVDTFGSILPNDLDFLFEIFNSILKTDIALGLHLHENLSISLALASIFIEKLKSSPRKAIIDSSVLGIGRIPGNLCTELIVNYLNLVNNSKYILPPIYNLIDSPISNIKKNNNWGYMPGYALTGFYKVHRSYAEHLLQKENMSTTLLDIILIEIKNSKNSLVFNQKYADYLYEKYS